MCTAIPKESPLEISGVFFERKTLEQFLKISCGILEIFLVGFLEDPEEISGGTLRGIPEVIIHRTQLKFIRNSFSKLFRYSIRMFLGILLRNFFQKYLQESLHESLQEFLCFYFSGILPGILFRSLFEILQESLQEFFEFFMNPSRIFHRYSFGNIIDIILKTHQNILRNYCKIFFQGFLNKLLKEFLNEIFWWKPKKKQNLVEFQKKKFGTLPEVISRACRNS